MSINWSLRQSQKNRWFQKDHGPSMGGLEVVHTIGTFLIRTVNALPAKRDFCRGSTGPMPNDYMYRVVYRSYQFNALCSYLGRQAQ